MSGFDFFFGRVLQRLREYLRLALLRQFQTRQSMIIETGFTDRDNARAFRQFAQRSDHIVRRFLRVGGMNADDRKHVRIFFRQFDRAPAAFDRSSDRDDARNAGLFGAPQDIIEVRREIRDNRDAREFL